MCSNFLPARREQLTHHFGVTPLFDDLPSETYPGYLAPLIRPSLENSALECVPACFGMVPHWADIKLARRTYNARTESVEQRPSYKTAWRKRQFCIIPVDSIFEPCYETGKAVRWQISHAKGRPLGIAGIWDWRPDKPDGPAMFSFSMLTINADSHPLMQRFHKPNEEKRMLVIVEPSQYEDWLHVSLDDAKKFLVPYPAEQLIAQPAPKPPRTKQQRTAA